MLFPPPRNIQLGNIAQVNGKEFNLKNTILSGFMKHVMFWNFDYWGIQKLSQKKGNFESEERI